MSRRRKTRPLYITTTAAGALVQITTRRPSAEALAHIGQPVKVELAARQPRQLSLAAVERHEAAHFKLTFT